MVTSATFPDNFEFRGLSSDVKPIGSNCSNGNVNFKIQNGSVFFEMDTSKVFLLKLVESNSGEVTEYTGTWIELQ